MVCISRSERKGAGIAKKQQQVYRRDAARFFVRGVYRFCTLHWLVTPGIVIFLSLKKGICFCYLTTHSLKCLTVQQKHLTMKFDDSLWKAILEDLFADFLRFFFSNADAIFDMKKGFEYLDKEMAQIAADRPGVVRFETGARTKPAGT
ncbi:MAG: hypothetical protein QM763_24280 [Agriterribacter sp.]